ncbi:MAG: hypothetical protein V3S71_02750 [Acidobacteriota bacterium]
MKIGDWVRLKEPVPVEGRDHHYGKIATVAPISLAFPIPVKGKSFEGPPGTAPKQFLRKLYAEDIKLSDIAEEIQQCSKGMGPSVGGSPTCRSHSLESGGNSAWCTCDGCF